MTSRSKRLVSLALMKELTYSDESFSENVSSESEYIPSSDVSDDKNWSITKMSSSPELPTLETIICNDHRCRGEYLSDISNRNSIEEDIDKDALSFEHNSSNICNFSLNESYMASQSCSTPQINEQGISCEKKINKKRIRKKHNCAFCDVQVNDFARHIERNHNDELAVQEIVSLDKKSLKRKKLIDKLRREGDFSTSNIIPVMYASGKNENQYIACSFCRGYYAPKSLRRHVKKCYFNKSDHSKRFNAQIEGQTIMSGHFGPNDILKTSGLLSRLRADEVSLVIKKDGIICEVGRRYLRSHKEKHLVMVAKRNMRRLARLLIIVRKLLGNDRLSLEDVLKASKFKTIVKATRMIAEYDEVNRNYKSPTLALQMGTILKSAINATYSKEVQRENVSSERLEQLKALTALIETDWAHEISSEAGQNLTINKFNKPTLIPLAEDISKFEKYLQNLILDNKTKLMQNPNDLRSFKNLQEGIFCSLLIFNKRRVGELQRMTLQSYLKTSQKAPVSQDFEKVLSESEKILSNSLKRVVIRGKRGRGVPVLFEKEIVDAIEFAINCRQKFDLLENPYLFGNPGTENPISGNVTMRKHANIAIQDISRASLLTSTKLRKHLATIIQILKMNKNELEQLATFMGHTSKTHEEFYRLPDDIYQTAKVSKLLLLAKTKSIEQYKGMSIADININLNTIEEESDTEDGILINEIVQDDTPQILPNNNSICSNNKPNKKMKNKKDKRVLTQWTERQKNVTNDYFKTHIKTKRAPRKNEVEALIGKHPDVFANKSWPVIKTYVQNMYTKKYKTNKVPSTLL